MSSSKRVFASGATRDTAEGKLDYEGFLSPLALEAFARYMHHNRRMEDGSERASDNWQKGIPLEAYMKSMWRHFMDVWRYHREQPTNEEHLIALTGLMFNVQGYLHELLTQGEDIGEQIDRAAEARQERWNGKGEPVRRARRSPSKAKKRR